MRSRVELWIRPLEWRRLCRVRFLGLERFGGSFLDRSHLRLDWWRRCSSFNGQPDDWVLYRNAYKNTLLWNVGEFFSRVFAKADMSNALLIYTSDHGQDLHERGNPGLNLHCGGDPVAEEGLVPLVVIQGDQLRTLDWQKALAANKDRSSHYNIFPTLLQLMGYDLAGIEAVYGKPLSVPTADDFTFNYRFNARLGAKPEWKYIDLNSIVTPSQAPTNVAVGQ